MSCLIICLERSFYSTSGSCEWKRSKLARAYGRVYGRRRGLCHVREGGPLGKTSQSWVAALPSQLSTNGCSGPCHSSIASLSDLFGTCKRRWGCCIVSVRHSLHLQCAPRLRRWLTIQQPPLLVISNPPPSARLPSFLPHLIAHVWHDGHGMIAGQVLRRSEQGGTCQQNAGWRHHHRPPLRSTSEGLQAGLPTQVVNGQARSVLTGPVGGRLA